MPTLEHRFVIKIKGIATYSPQSLKLKDPLKESPTVKEFKEEVEKLLARYYDEIKAELDALVPLSINPIIDGEFFFTGVEDEA